MYFGHCRHDGKFVCVNIVLTGNKLAVSGVLQQEHNVQSKKALCIIKCVNKEKQVLPCYR